MGLWSLKTIESTFQRFIVSSHVPVYHPFTKFHLWVDLVLSYPVHAIAGLAPNVRQLRVSNSLLKLC
mgnify:CR=1 FL=1